MIQPKEEEKKPGKKNSWRRQYADCWNMALFECKQQYCTYHHYDECTDENRYPEAKFWTEERD